MFLHFIIQFFFSKSVYTVLKIKLLLKKKHVLKVLIINSPSETPAHNVGPASHAPEEVQKNDVLRKKCDVRRK